MKTQTLPALSVRCKLNQLTATIIAKLMQDTITYYDGHIEETLNELPVTVIRKITVHTRKLASGSWETLYLTNGRPSGNCISRDRQYNLSEILEEIREIGYTLSPYTGRVLEVAAEVSETAKVA